MTSSHFGVRETILLQIRLFTLFYCVSDASELIRKLLTVNPSKRATIVDICVDYWVNLGYEHSLLQVAEDMANLTPVRLDLLLALAPDADIPLEEPELQGGDDVTANIKTISKDVPDEEEEEEEEDEDANPDTAANSFAFMKGSRASQLSVSSPNLQDAVDEYEDDSENDFLPADIAAALQAECGKRLADSSSSFGASLGRVSSTAHQSKKPRKSDSANVSNDKIKKDPTGEKIDEKSKSVSASKSSKDNIASMEKKNVSNSPNVSNSKLTPSSPLPEKQNTSKSSSNIISKNASGEKANLETENQNQLSRKDSLSTSKFSESPFIAQRKESLTTQDEKVETKKFVRPPGKIIIPKTFDSPQSTPSPKPVNAKKLIKSDSKSEPEDNQQVESAPVSPEVSKKGEKQLNLPSKSSNEDINKNLIESEPKTENNLNIISEEKKNVAKSILKKGIAKAKLAERRMSKQSSVDSEVSSCSTPVSAGGTPEPKPSFFKTPKPYTKEEDTNVMSKAEIKLSSTQSSNSTLKNESACHSKAPLWDARCEDRQLQDKNLNWSAISSTIDSEMSNWREEMEESLRRLSPEDERSSNQAYVVSKFEDDKPLVPIARSYKKFTFTKDGACITETKKIYTTPGADGSWTKVEKKTKITTRPGNAEEFEKFRDLHLRTEASNLVRSDSQSSSGSNEVYDDIFDSWTGDTMMCNMRKMNNMFQKFSRDPFLRRERRRNPFRFFRRTESERDDRNKKPYEARSGRSTERESSENDEDYDVHFDDSSAVVYGSQGLWQLLRSANTGLPGRVTIHHEPISYGRSVSQDRSESKVDPNWKRCGSRTSSGYNTGTRSQSRDRTESPREKVLRFVFENPREGISRESSVRDAPAKHEKWSIKRNLSRHNPRRDSGVGSDGYESEYSVRQCPSDEMSRAGRVSSMSSICSDKQGMIRNFMKSWSKEFMSPPTSPTSIGSAKEQLESLPEARKHRVEQWLDMNSDSMPFDRCNDGSRMSSRKSSTSHGNSSPVYATMRPREYMHYNRSSSDKLSECSDFFPSFDDRRRSQTLNKNDSQNEMGKTRFRTAAYSPVSEESLRDVYSTRHSDSPGSSVHHINFTFSDGRSSSSHTTPQTTRYVRQFSSSKDGCITVESPPGSVRVEQQISSRSPTQPVVQMRVSINRGNRESPVSPPSQPSKGLWEQQESLRTPRQDGTKRSPSPVPGIRQFSTEVQHCIVGTPENAPQMSVECEVSSLDKKSPQNTPTGKSSPYKHHLPTGSSLWDLACPSPCMENAPELTNINKHDHLETSTEHYALSDSQNRPKSFPPFPTECGSSSNAASHQTISSNEPNTPDSLEDSNVPPIRIKTSSDELLPTDKLDTNDVHVEVKPLGILWSACSSKNAALVPDTESNPCVTFVQAPRSSPSSIRSDESEMVDLQKKCIERTTPEIGSIWNQKKPCHPFDLLKNLLSEDGLDSFTSSKCVMGSSHPNQNNCPDLTINNENTYGQGTVVIDKHITVIDNIELDRLTCGDRFGKGMPSLMDDLQSPKEVLRQAMKICDSLEH